MKPAFDQELLADLMANFESQEDLEDGNPFDFENIDEVLQAIEPFLTGGAIPDTVGYLHPGSSVGDGVHAGAIAGMLQGLAIGFDYARRCNGTDGD